MTVEQKILIALFTLHNKIGSVIEYEDVIVEAFKLFPDDFSLKKYPNYPDSNSINKKIYDSLKPKGLIKIKNLKISLTNHGLILAEKYYNSFSGKEINTDLQNKLTKSEIVEIKRLFKCKGFELFINEHKYEILDIDIYDFFEISVRTSLSDIKNRFSTINALIKKSIKSINKPEIEQLAEYKDLLINKYEEIRNGNSS